VSHEISIGELGAIGVSPVSVRRDRMHAVRMRAPCPLLLDQTGLINHITTNLPANNRRLKVDHEFAASGIRRALQQSQALPNSAAAQYDQCEFSAHITRHLV
jgi:hypothetical protein